MNCPNCGSYLSDDAVFCNTCGKKIEFPEPVPSEMPPAKSGKASGKSALMIILAVCLLAAIACIVILVTGKNDTENTEPATTESAAVSETPSAQPTATPKPKTNTSTQSTLTADEQIKQIKDWYYSFQNNSAVVENSVGKTATISTLYGDIGEVTVWRSDSGNSFGPDGTYTAFHYYNNGVPYFTLLQDQNKNLIRLYYWDGKLISWITPDGVRSYGSTDQYNFWYYKAQSAYSAASGV